MNRKPSRADILAAANTRVPDLFGPGLKVLFCGTNPGLYSAAIGHHFGRPGNRFWPAAFAGGFTERLFSPYEDADFMALGYGLTNIHERATAGMAELSNAELKSGYGRLKAKVLIHAPKYLAVLSIGAYRIAFDRPEAKLGLQSTTIGATRVWLLPSPSGLNAHYQPSALANLFAELRAAVESGGI